MEVIKQFVDLILHIDVHLIQIANAYQYWTYLILFVIIFAETGLVVTPFLPGDSVLFAVGALMAKPETHLNVWLMFAVLLIAAVLGDFVNYEIGKYFGAKAFREDSKIFKPAYLAKTESFYKKHGNKTIIYARFVPIVRTFAPFIAGISRMPYANFVRYNFIGGLLWVALFIFGGYFFGQIPFVKNNFSIVIVAILFLSLLPIVFEFLKKKN